MPIFITLFLKLIPLYLMILLGYLGASRLNAQKETLAKLLIYIIAPIVIFYGSYTVDISLSTLLLPLIIFFICCLNSLVFYWLGSLLTKGSNQNLLSFSAGTGNTGYFGLPVILLLFGNEGLALAVLMILGFLLYENTLGFFIIARGNYKAKTSLLKLLKLPTIYAFFIGIILNFLGIELGSSVTEFISPFKASYTLLGMMMIGMGLESIQKKNLDTPFMAMVFFAKFIWWPILVLALIYLDKNWLQLYSQEIHKTLIIMASVPVAANTVALATELNVHPGKAALVVISSTFFALFYIPFMSFLLY